jgi:hypothetical protein
VITSRQTGSVTFSGSSTTAAITTVDLSRAVLLIWSTASTTVFAAHATRAKLEASQITFSSLDGSISKTVEWLVLEADHWTVERGETALTGTTTDVAVSSVDVAKTWVVSSSDGTTSASMGVASHMSAADTLRLRVHTLDSGQRANWQLVTFTDATTVYSGQRTNTGSSVDFTVTAVDTSRSFVWLSATQHAGLADHYYSARLIDSTTVRMQRTPNSGAGAQSWQIIELPTGASVQYVAAATGGTATTTHTITAVDTSRTIAFAARDGRIARGAGSGNANVGRVSGRISLTSSTEITIVRGNATDSATWDVFVVEFAAAIPEVAATITATIAAPVASATIATIRPAVAATITATIAAPVASATVAVVSPTDPPDPLDMQPRRIRLGARLDDSVTLAATLNDRAGFGASLNDRIRIGG